MRIVLHSNAPWWGTGYGRQTALLAPRLVKAGHEVVISAFAGLSGAPQLWNGIPVLPGASDDDPAGLPQLLRHARFFGADLIITLMDQWALNPVAIAQSGQRFACWMPVDTGRLGAVDAEFLQLSGVYPVAMSRHGHKLITGAGHAAAYIPHAVDLGIFTPGDMAEARRLLQLPPDLFIIGMNAANNDKARKGFFEQIQAFSWFHAKHPESLLLIHTIANRKGGLDLHEIARYCGVGDAVAFTPQNDLMMGLFPDEWVADWYRSIDVLSACSRGEGFGIPIIEAQACGKPVVVTRASTGPELCGEGWMVSGQDYWNDLHQVCWTTPSISEIARVYERAFKEGRARHGDAARAFARQYDIETVAPGWGPVITRAAGQEQSTTEAEGR